MKIRFIVFALCVLFVMGLSGNALAFTDPTGDNLVANVDIASSSVVTYDKPSFAEIPDFAKIGIKMAPGSHLPGAVIFDFDVDNDTATGGGSVITGIPAGNCAGLPCKAPAGDGFDFYVVLVLRTQGDTSNLSLCSGCSGSSNTCVNRGVPSSCDQGICYQLGSPCNIGDPGCYEIAEGGACSNCVPDITSYPLDTICGATAENCQQRLTKGEYYVGYGSQNSVLIGNVLLENTFNVHNEGEICATIPWSHIVTQMFTRILRDTGSPPFDASVAVNNPPKYQVSVFYDPVFADEDDLFTFPGLNLDVSDWLPDTVRVADSEYNRYPPCLHNSAGGYGNVSVDANDVGDFLNEFGRNNFDRTCPNCKN